MREGAARASMWLGTAPIFIYSRDICGAKIGGGDRLNLEIGEIANL